MIIVSCVSQISECVWWKFLSADAVSFSCWTLKLVSLAARVTNEWMESIINFLSWQWRSKYRSATRRYIAQYVCSAFTGHDLFNLSFLFLICHFIYFLLKKSIYTTHTSLPIWVKHIRDKVNTSCVVRRLVLPLPVQCGPSWSQCIPQGWGPWLEGSQDDYCRRSPWRRNRARTSSGLSNKETLVR